MKPLDLITWAIAIGFAWAAFVYFIPIDRWVDNFLARRQARLKELEGRVATLKCKLNEKAAVDPQTGQADCRRP